jgi:hypothetical protein
MFYWNNRAGLAVIEGKASTRGYVESEFVSCFLCAPFCLRPQSDVS